MKVFDKRIYFKGSITRKIKYFFGMPYCETIMEQNGDMLTKKHAFPFDMYCKASLKKDAPFFYLKVNSMDFITIPCLQHWIDVIHEMNGDFVIVCDKEELKSKILKQCCFHEPNPKFIKSYIRPLKSIVKNICRTKVWRNAAHAHLSTFYHACKNGIKNFWNIDADDTMIFLSKERCAEMLFVAQKTAEEQKLDAYSLDMHLSETFNKLWTFGITYIRDAENWMSRFYNLKDNSWTENYLIIDKNISCDILIDYFKNTKMAKIGTFYAENLFFCHYANLLTWSIGEAMYNWTNGILHFPLFNSLGVDKFDVKICDECDKLAFDISDEESIEIAREKFLYTDTMKRHRENWLKTLEFNK